MKKVRDPLLFLFISGIVIFMSFGLFVTGYSVHQMGSPTGFAVATPGVARTVSPSTVAPGGTVTVTLTVTLQGQFVWAIEETIPAGFTVINSGTPSGTTSSANILKWISYSSTSTPLTSTSITYTIKAPTTQGTYSFSGNYLLDTMSATSAITGTTSVIVQNQVVPTTEICDGKDNDLDGLIDEGFTLELCQYVCTANKFVWTNLGAVDPKLNCCGNDPFEDSPYANEYAGASLTLCDGRDNDCSGTIDEGYTTEECERTCLDNGGDDYDALRITGRKCCGDHYASPFFEANPYEEKEVTCSDGQDNDCDGLIDKADADCADCLTNTDCGRDNNACNGLETCTAGSCTVTNVPVIDDKITCTIDSCNTATGAVTHTPSNALCLDGKWCNGAETCSASSGCLNGQAQACADTLPCSRDYCDEGTDLTDNNGACTHDTTDCQCTSALQCDDSNPCTTDSCTTGQCVQAPATGGSCDDKFFCTIDDRCVNGACLGSQRNIDDNIPCTSDSCDEAKDTITHIADSSKCQDSLFCNGPEVCDALTGCKAGTAPTLSDGVDCTEDSCDESTDRISHLAVNSRCQDMKWCNGQEVCQAATGCAFGSAPVCADGISCSLDSCSEGTQSNDNIGECVFDLSKCACTNDADCNDNNPCTDDQCNPDKSCKNTADDTNTCTDGKWCTVNDRCLAGACVANPKPVDDSISCTEDSCDEAGQKINHVTRNDLCDDKLYCNGAEICGSTGCQAGVPPRIDDTIACTQDSCDEANDLIKNIPVNSICLDGRWCNGAETCSASSGCVNGQAQVCSDTLTCTQDSCDEGTDMTDNNGVCKFDTTACQCTLSSQCDDSNPCTTDSCQAGKCVQAPATGGSCDDKFFCTVDDRCVNGACLGSQKNIDDSIPCTSDSCDEAKDTINHIPDSSKCQDSLFCNGQEVCDATSGCKAGTVSTLSDGIDCTEDSCDESTDRINHVAVNSRCQDMKWCNGQEICQSATGCVSGSVPVCADSISCSLDYCSEGTHIYDNIGQCAFDFSKCSCTKDADCNDNNPCTDDQCGADKSCKNIADDTNTCTDGKWCTVNDRCLSGACVANPKPVDDSISCTEDSCDEAGQKINHVPRNDICDDKLYCNGAETCGSTGCQGGVAPKTDDKIACTQDSCDEAKDLIKNTPVDSLCLDGSWCNGAETCDAVRGCLDGAPPNCDDGLSCSADSCSELSIAGDNLGECRFSMTGCSCTRDLDCDDSNPCTNDRCSSGHTCVRTNNDTAICDDGQFCTISDRCLQGSCSGLPRQIDDAHACTKDYCDENRDSIVHVANDSLCDDRNWCNGKETCSVISGCGIGVPPSCDDTLLCTADACSELLDRCISSAIDADRDSFTICEGNSKDCNDAKSDIFPGAREDCANTFDDDCDGTIDSADPQCFICTPGDVRSCPRQEGACQGAKENCTSTNSWPGCDAATYLRWSALYQVNETNLTDGIDNDCDGIIRIKQINISTNYSNVSQNITYPWPNQTYPCIELWVVDEWGECDAIGYRHRAMIDRNSCNTTLNKPASTEICQISSSCGDGFMNGDETGIDCGGSCPEICNNDGGEDGGSIDDEYEMLIESGPISGGILEEIEHKVTLTNNGEKEIVRFTLGADRWSKGVDVQSILPGESKTVRIKLQLPEQPTTESVNLRAIKDGVILGERSVSSIVTVPNLDMRIIGNGETGEVFLTIIADNSNKQGRTIDVSTTIQKGKEIYYFDTNTHQLAPNKVYHRTDKLTGFSIKKGEYQVESVFVEDGDELTSKAASLTIDLGEEAFNASLIFYLFMLGIICITGYLMYTIYQKR